MKSHKKNNRDKKWLFEYDKRYPIHSFSFNKQKVLKTDKATEPSNFWT